MVKTRSTLIMDADLWKRFKMIAILNEMEVSELVEQALREKLERMKQLEQYPEYKDVKNLRVQPRSGKHSQQEQHKPVVHSSRYEAAKVGENAPTKIRAQPQEQNLEASQGGQIQQLIQKHSTIAKDGWGINKDKVKPSFNEDEIALPLFIPGLRFPTNKEKIIQHIKRLQEKNDSGYDDELEFSRMLPDLNKTYNHKLELEGDITKLMHKIKDLRVDVADDKGEKTLKIVGCKIFNAKDSNGSCIEYKLKSR